MTDQKSISASSLGFPALFVFLWSTGFLGAKYGAPDSEPMSFLTVRFAILVVLLIGLSLLGKPKWPDRITAAHSLVVGALIHGIYLGGVFWAIDRGMPANISVMIIGLQPILTALFAWKLLGEEPTRWHWGGLALGLFGLSLIVSGKKAGIDGGVLTVETIGACVIGVFAIALGTVYQKRFATGVDLRTGGIFQYLGALIITAPYGLFGEQLDITWTAEFIFALAWLIIVLSIGAIFLLMRLIQTGAVSNIAALFYLVPVSTALLSWLMFDEELTLIQMVGMLLISAAVALATRKHA
ncbi:DMT family transporter [Coralliovum pocilloporae]|uniref:DMT family transporter n=1 Tax=Coralliovum pocilloporae TaxID=3066369 RepID=UPI00330738C6